MSQIHPSLCNGLNKAAEGSSFYFALLLSCCFLIPALVRVFEANYSRAALIVLCGLIVQYLLCRYAWPLAPIQTQKSISRDFPLKVAAFSFVGLVLAGVTT